MTGEKGQSRTVPPSSWPPVKDALSKASWALIDSPCSVPQGALLVASSQGRHHRKAHSLCQPPGATPSPCSRSEAGSGCARVGPHFFFAKVRTSESSSQAPLSHSPPNQACPHSSPLQPLLQGSICSSFGGLAAAACRGRPLTGSGRPALQVGLPALSPLRLLTPWLESLHRLPVSSPKSYQHGSLHSRGAHYWISVLPACPLSTAQTQSQQAGPASWLTTDMARKENHPKGHFPALPGEDSPAVLVIKPTNHSHRLFLGFSEPERLLIKRSWIVFLRRKLKPQRERGPSTAVLLVRATNCLMHLRF